jgi:hypothetical protein
MTLKKQIMSKNRTEQPNKQTNLKKEKIAIDGRCYTNMSAYFLCAFIMPSAYSSAA